MAASWLIDPSAPPRQTTETGDGPQPEEPARRESAHAEGPTAKPPIPKPETQPDRAPTDTDSTAAAPRAPQPIDTPDSTERSAPDPVAAPRRATNGPLEQLRHRAEQGEPFSQYRLATALWRMGNRHEAKRWYRRAEGGLARLAAAGNGQAQYTLGAMYAFGKGVQRDDDEAHRYLTLAAGQRIEPARRVLKIVERRSGERAASGR